MIKGFVQSLSFTQSHTDSNLYIYREGTTLVLLLLYVDDISMAYPSNTAAVVKNIKAKPADKYRITNLGAVRQFLGIESASGISEDTNRPTISLGQRAFIDSILKRFRMENAHGAATPMDVNVQLDLAKDGEESIKQIQYVPAQKPPHSRQARGTVPQVDCPPPPTLQQRRRQRYHRLHSLRLGKRQRRPQIARRSCVYSE